MELLLSTRNPSKALQIQTFFNDSGIAIKTLAEAGIDGEAIEDGTTLEENAFKKAVYAQERSPGNWTMADDTGLFIDALDGRPGIHAARWAGDVSTEEILAYTLAQLEGQTDRRAAFRTVVVLLAPDGTRHAFMGEVRGILLEAARVPAQPMMPYSPLFVPEGETHCWAEMTTERENELSHRGKAFAQVRAFLERVSG